MTVETIFLEIYTAVKVIFHNPIHLMRFQFTWLIPALCCTMTFINHESKIPSVTYYPFLLVLAFPINNTRFLLSLCLCCVTVANVTDYLSCFIRF